MGENCRLGLEREGDEAGEPMRFILKLAKLPEVIDALLERFDMTVEHRGRAASSHVVPDAVHIQPFGRALLPSAKLVAHISVENLSPTASESA